MYLECLLGRTFLMVAKDLYNISGHDQMIPVYVKRNIFLLQSTLTKKPPKFNPSYLLKLEDIAVRA